jgi:Ca2+-binding RTX toxin-like protein
VESLITFGGGNLVITGSETSGDRITLTGNAANLTVSYNGKASLYQSVITINVNGLGGSDVIDLSAISIASTISGGNGNDTITGSTAGDELNGNGGNDVINGGTGNDLISGLAGNDNLLGNGNNDTLVGHDGNDTLSGESGADEASYFYTANNIRVDLDGTANDYEYSGTSSTILFTDLISSSTENLNGGGGADRIFGNAVANDLKGNGGNDTIYGNAGADTIQGSSGNDNLYSNNGSASDGIVDQIFGGSGTGDSVIADQTPFDIVNSDVETVTRV